MLQKLQRCEIFSYVALLFLIIPFRSQNQLDDMVGQLQQKLQNDKHKLEQQKMVAIILLYWLIYLGYSLLDTCINLYQTILTVKKVQPF